MFLSKMVECKEQGMELITKGASCLCYHEITSALLVTVTNGQI